MTNQTPSQTVRFALHFGMLFTVALIAWAVFSQLYGGSIHVLPGIVAAAVLGALGTYIALRSSEAHDLRARDAAEGYAIRQAERTMARTGTPFVFRISRSRPGHPISGD